MARDPVKLFVKSRWTVLNVRCANGKYHRDSSRNNSYAEINIMFTRSEFANWCRDRWESIQAMRKPSIDRLDKRLDYTLDNMQVIELAENIRKDKTVFRDGYGVCYRCKERKMESMFCVDRRRMNGRTSLCLDCERLRRPRLTGIGKPRLGAERIQVLRERLSAGLSVRQAAEEVGCSLATADRMRRSLRSGGGVGRSTNT